MLAPTADIICGRPSSCRASISGADSKLGTDSTFYTRLCARYKLLYCIVLYCYGSRRPSVNMYAKYAAIFEVFDVR